MPDLIHSLQGQDLAHLRVIANLWDIDFNPPDVRSGLRELAARLPQKGLAEATVGALPELARTALEDLIRHGGKLPWPVFTRRYGAVREMGSAARERERPWLQPTASISEILWYRALLGRAFFDTPNGAEEFAYIPEDILPLVPIRANSTDSPLGRAATPSERAVPQLVNDQLLDDATTLLAALRIGIVPIPPLPSTLKELLRAVDLLDPNDIPQPENTKIFLEASRADALAQLYNTWLASPDFNELRQIPGLQCDGEWRNDPFRARSAVLGFLSRIDTGKWWSLTAFLADIRQQQPDFQRPAGDYDSWYIRDIASGEYLRGFEHWDQVDGALVRYILTGPLHWLGVIDLASPDENTPVTAFRHSAWAQALLNGQAPARLPLEKDSIKVDSSARISIPRLAPRAVRYQLARFGEWLEPHRDIYRYQITPAALSRARSQGLTATHLMKLLQRHADSIAPSLTKSLTRWEECGVEASFEQATILRVSSPELIQTLRNSRAARFLGDPLGPTAILVKSGAEEKVMAVLAEMGYLGEIKTEKG